MKKIIVALVMTIIMVAITTAVIFVFNHEIRETMQAEVLKREVFVMSDDVDGNVQMTAQFGMQDTSRLIVREFRANGNTLTFEIVDGRPVKCLFRIYGWTEVDVTSHLDVTEVPE